MPSGAPARVAHALVPNAHYPDLRARLERDRASTFAKLQRFEVIHRIRSQYGAAP